MKIRPATEEKKKIIANIYTPLFELLDYKINNALLKRDAYLDIAIASEIEHLDKEVSHKNSNKAYKYIFDISKREKRMPVSLNLSISTIDRMNEVCKSKNIPRDAFINRLILFMTFTSNKAINAVMPVFNETYEEDRCYFMYPENHDPELKYIWLRPSIFDSIREYTELSPLFYIRELIASEYDKTDKKPFGVYDYPIKQGNPLSDIDGLYKEILDMSGLNVTLTDDYVELFEEKDAYFKDRLDNIVKQEEIEKGLIREFNFQRSKVDLERDLESALKLFKDLGL